MKQSITAQASATSAPSLLLKRKWIELLSATIEAWSHQLLYARQVYPRDVFAATRFLGVRCFSCRHPTVVSYISNAIKAAIPALVQGVGDEISFVVTDDRSCHDGVADHSTYDLNETKVVVTDTVEKFTLRLSEVKADVCWDEDTESDSNFQIIQHTIQNLERSMRELILVVHALESRDDMISLSDAASFKLSLHIPVENKTCSELNHVFSEGTWLACEKHSNQGAVVRPLHQSVTALGTFQFVSQKVSTNKNRRHQGNRKKSQSCGGEKGMPENVEVID